MSLSCSTVCWASLAARSVALLTVLTDRHRKRNHHMVKTKKIWSVVSKPWSLLRSIVGLCAVLLNPAFLHTLTYLSVFFIFHVSCLKIFLFFFNSASWNTRLLLASPSSHTRRPWPVFNGRVSVVRYLLSLYRLLLPALTFSAHMQAVTLCSGCLTGDRWHRFHRDRVSLLQSAASLGLTYRWNRRPDKPLFMLPQSVDIISSMQLLW